MPKRKTMASTGEFDLSLLPGKLQTACKRKCSAYASVTKALSANIPEHLVGRCAEREKIKQFLESSVSKKLPGCMYISGAPGTGKTACIQRIMDTLVSKDVKKVWVNCMTLKSGTAIYNHILTCLKVKYVAMSSNGAKQKLDSIFTNSKSMYVIVLDEIDYLDAKYHDILYSIIEWPVLKDSHVILLGIANALDLTDRLLPRLTTFPGLKPELLHFPPYTRDELKEIITARISSIEDSTTVISPAALQLLSCKVSAITGDARKALAVCSRSMEVAEKKAFANSKVQTVQEQTYGVSPAIISSVLCEVYDHPVMHNSNEMFQNLPIHQKLTICALLINMRIKKVKEVQTKNLLVSYEKVCKQHHASPVGSSEFLGLLSMLETQGIISIKKQTPKQPCKITLSLDEEEVKSALLDDALLTIVMNCS